MLYTPDDPKRFDDNYKEQILAAHQEIYRLALECCGYLRTLVSAEGAEDNPDGFQLVDLSIIKFDDVEDLSVGVDIHIRRAKQKSQCPDGELVDMKHLQMDLKPSKIHVIFKKLRQDLREVIAAYLLPTAYQQLSEKLDEEQKYDEISALAERFQELRERLIDGDLPMPRGVSSSKGMRKGPFC